MHLRLPLFFSLFLGCLGANAQKPSSQPDTIATPGLRIGFDLSRMVYTLVRPERPRLEVAADLSWKRSFFAAELGTAAIRLERPERYNYRLSGIYGRLGLDKNLLKGDDVVFVGFRYALSRYQHEATAIAFQEPYWGGSGAIPDQEASHLAQWLEGVGGVKVHIWQNLGLGFTFRTKFLLSNPGNDDFRPLEIPGYGEPSKRVRAGFNYYLFWRLDFRKKTGS